LWNNLGAYWNSLKYNLGIKPFNDETHWVIFGKIESAI